jgi:hypothetical protein
MKIKNLNAPIVLKPFLIDQKICITEATPTSLENWRVGRNCQGVGAWLAEGGEEACLA